jgi:hypothetical protein
MRKGREAAFSYQALSRQLGRGPDDAGMQLKAEG